MVDISEEIGDGLRLRTASPADRENLIRFHGLIQREPGEESSLLVTDWIGALIGGTHPEAEISNFTIVEKIDTGEIVSSLALLTEPLAYAGLPFDAGRIEFVSTSEEFRRRGLVRKQIDLAHRWSDDKGQLVQVISGVPTLYRRFGYEMAIELSGGRSGTPFGIPGLEDGAPEPFLIRPATTADIAFILRLDEQQRNNWVITRRRDDSLLRCQIETSRVPQYRNCIELIENPDGVPVGYLSHLPTLWSGRVPVMACEIENGVSYLEVMPSVLRHLRDAGASYAEHEPATAFEGISFTFGSDHPVYRALPRYLSRQSPPYAWYVRVKDLPRYLSFIAPVLDERFARSVAAGHSGELVLGSYEGSVRLVLERGRLAAAEPSADVGPDDCSAWFPGLSFLQLVFGFRSLAELEHASPDCMVNTERARVLLDALFPKQASRLWPLG
jgi:hypothetical protein